MHVQEDMRAKSVLSTALLSTDSSDTDLRLLLHILYHSDLRTRKDVLTVIRVRDHPNRNHFLAHQVATLHRHDLYPTTHLPSAVKLDDVYLLLETIIHPSDVLVGLFSMFIRNLPLPKWSDWRAMERQARATSALKEFWATQTINSPSTINYRAVLGTAEEREDHWHPTIPLRPNLQHEIHDILRKWRGRLAGRVLYPKSSKKSMGVESSMNLCQIAGWDYRKCSTLDLERWYRDTGEMSEGPVEMRQAWFFNDLKPRTYFANGATTYRHSRYIQPIFNSLLDAIPNTHRIRRFRMKRLRIRREDIVIVYDYTSFTSRMSEQRHFIQELAEFCRGVIVVLVDSYSGPVEMDLGDLLDDYNRYCNTEAEFRIRQDILEFTELEDIVYRHQCAGFLGVLGNLASCTALHGIHLALITNGFGTSSCVGDDALGVMEIGKPGELEVGEIQPLGSVPDVVDAISVLGEIQREKTKLMEFEDRKLESTRWQYLKRCLDRMEEELILGNIVVVPTFGMIYSSLTAKETTRRLNTDLSIDEIRDRFASQAFSCVRSLYHLRSTLREWELMSIFDYLRQCYVDLELPKSGWVFYERGYRYVETCRSVTLLPPMPTRGVEMSYIQQDPIMLLAQRAPEGEVEVPSFTFDLVDNDSSMLIVGSKFRSTGSQKWAYAERMEYVTKSEVLFKTSDPEDFLRIFLDRGSRQVYEYEVVRDLPSWFDIL
jgi:hypothetical protein